MFLECVSKPLLRLHHLWVLTLYNLCVICNSPTVFIPLYSNILWCINFSAKIRFARVCPYVDDFNNRNLFLTAMLLKQVYRYHKIRKAFSKFYHRHSELIVKYNIGLKTLLQQVISATIFQGDLVYKFKRFVGKPNFSDHSKRLSNVI